MTISQNGKDPLVSLEWDKKHSYSVQAHGSCKGFSSGMCGTWDDDADNDLTGPDGTQYDTSVLIQNLTSLQLIIEFAFR